MRAVEVTGRIDEKGQLILDKPIEIRPISSVRIIILFSETTDELEPEDDRVKNSNI